MLRYFLGIDVMQSKHEILLSQSKYVLDLLSDDWKVGGKHHAIPSLMVPGVHLTREGKTI